MGWRSVTSSVLAFVVALVLAVAGGSQLSGFEPQAEPFISGALQLLAAVLLLVSSTRVFGAALAALSMLGATSIHLWNGELGAMLFPLVTGGGALLSAWLWMTDDTRWRRRW